MSNEVAFDNTENAKIVLLHSYNQLNVKENETQN